MSRIRQLARAAWSYTRRRVRWRDVVFVALVGVSLLYSVHYANALQAAQQHLAAAAQAAQRREGALIEQKLCTTFGRLAARKPPGGSPDANPSRAYLQWQHDVLAEIGPDIGCPGARKRHP